MPKIFLRGEHEPMVVTNEDADRILSQKNDASYKGMIDVGTRKVQKSVIKEVRYDETNATQKYNIDIPADREVIKEFERWLEGLKGGDLPHPLEYYGRPLADQQKFPGYVLHDLFGGVHITFIAWALENRIITKRGDRWAIVAHGNLDMSAYTDLTRKLNALAELRGKRQYAERKEAEAIDKTVEEHAIKPDDLPF